ncbi:protein FAR1-RELATED SEQUENCE 5-like [Chenopodium quinoa]|uniref:protein FAR1-RELATED SEQUENCE 5-like n=1 Tax=Chenopodium quinoa TaxID=63459 RepID=UPI000B773529|nr:protein FAR1-RELATED SEQUENCE 5-like [Chenopodium quinoa]
MIEVVAVTNACGLMCAGVVVWYHFVDLRVVAYRAAFLSAIFNDNLIGFGGIVHNSEGDIMASTCCLMKVNVDSYSSSLKFQQQQESTSFIDYTEMMSNNEQLGSHSSTITNVPTTPTIVVSPKVAPLLTPGGTKEWLPICPNELKPAIEMKDLKAYIQGSDAQMFVDNFTNKKLMWSAFFFDFEMDEDYCLYRALWADPLCKKSYALFGDMVSFDTTYQTNRYNMMFTPFTRVDHHKSYITFAAGFIAKEDIVSFDWLFRSFLKAMGGNEPNCMITDQDPAMKIAVKSVFNKTEHRFCMWHIMKKLPDKVEKSIMQEETGFLKKICACVWHLEIEPAEFEERWNKVMVDYHLEDHEWLGYMYKIRDKWILAYFRDVFLRGIMRTTSRSESENNFFCSFINPHVSLVEFYLRYEAAIDAQRHTQVCID